ncbi:MAG: hypothetical protein NT170_01545 [Candidatus Moranbacteria bacterium]|nr:hypothetical protein [Candidatus Moranbacteria bacterium]
MKFSVSYPYKKGDLGRDQGEFALHLHTLSKRNPGNLKPDGGRCVYCLFFEGHLVKVKGTLLLGGKREITMCFCHSTHDGKILVK